MNHEKFMRLALIEAQAAFDAGEVPIGAVIVSPQGEVIGAGHNQVEEQYSQVAHAEMIAIKQAGNSLGDWRLSGCTIYITLEPCAMCMSAILLSRMKKVVFAAPSPLFGYRVDKQISFAIYNCPIEIHEGILESDASALLRSFFSNFRKE